MKPHIPRVRVTTATPNQSGMTPAIFTRVFVDDKEWAVTDFAIKGNVDGLVTITVTFLADATVEHPESRA